MPNRRALDGGVIIIGGGIAGLGAAQFLARRGFSVTVLEAKDRLGGRIHTVHHEGLPIELGAEFIHGRSKVLLAAISSAGLATHRVNYESRVLENGKLKKKNVWDEIGRVISKIDARLPDVSFAKFISESGLAEETQRLAAGFVQGFDAAHTDRISAHSLRRAEYSAEHMDGSWQGRIDKGYAALVQALTEDIVKQGGRLETGAVVREINWKPGAVEVTAHQQQEPVRREASVAIITLPVGAWKGGAVQFRPALSQKDEAIREMHFGNVVKVVLVFRERWWPGGGFVQAFDELFPTLWDDSRGPILVTWAGGPKADALLNLSQSALEDLCVSIVAKVFAVQPGFIRQKLAASFTHNWADDPHIRGAYSYMPVGGMDLPKSLAEPIHDTLYFAGEATVSDAQTGTVFGGLESGIRAAREILQSQKFSHAGRD